MKIHATRKGSFGISGWWRDKKFEACLNPNCNCRGVVIDNGDDLTYEGTGIIKKILNHPDVCFVVEDDGVILEFKGKAEVVAHFQTCPFRS